MKDLIIFTILSVIAVVSSLFVFLSREIFRGALSLSLLLVTMAMFFAMLGAEFIAAVQILVYAGGVLVLILFAIMLTREREPSTSEITLSRAVALVAFVVISLFYLTKYTWERYVPEEEMAATGVSIGTELFQVYVIPFEAASFLLLAAMIGAIYLAKKEKERRKREVE